jgi:hypothetical protein
MAGKRDRHAPSYSPNRDALPFPCQRRYPIIAGQTRAAFVQPIAIFRGWACFAFGRVSVNTPSSRLALIFS